MNCKTARELLSAYLDRELASAERDAVRAHLASCDGCRTEERELRALKGILLGVRAPEPAPDFEQRLMIGLREEATKPIRRPLLPSLRPLVAMQFGGLAATAALAAFVLVRTPHAAPVVPAVVPTRPSETVVKAVDVDAYAEGYEAYSTANGFTRETSLLMTSDAP